MRIIKVLEGAMKRGHFNDHDVESLWVSTAEATRLGFDVYTEDDGNSLVLDVFLDIASEIYDQAEGLGFWVYSLPGFKEKKRLRFAFPQE